MLPNHSPRILTRVQAAIQGAKALHTHPPHHTKYSSPKPSSRSCTPHPPAILKQARSNQRSLSSGKQGAAKTSCQTGKEDKMVTSVPSGNLLFSPGCSTQPRLKRLQETFPSPHCLLASVLPSSSRDFNTNWATCCSGNVERPRSGPQWLVPLKHPQNYLPLSVASQAPELEEGRWWTCRLHKK